MPKDNAKPQRLQPLVAWRALRVLLNDPEDTAQVFTIIRALTGRSLENAFERFRGTDTGRSILQEKRRLLDLLSDREALRAMPAESLGRAYLHFMESQALTADGLVDASEGTVDIEDKDLALYAERIRDQHDLWHTVTGFGRDTMGEVCLLAFTVAQLKNPGLALITIAGMLKITRENTHRIIPATWAAFRAGRRAQWLPAQDWEALLARPIDEVRAMLNIGVPAVYPEIAAEPAAA